MTEIWPALQAVSFLSVALIPFPVRESLSITDRITDDISASAWQIAASMPSQKAMESAVTNELSCDVIVVEDDIIQCEEMAGFLSRAGLAVETAYNAAAALRKAAALQPRVALLDFNLPDMTGVELAEQLRAVLPSLAILMMSGRIDGLSEHTLNRLGITVFVNKPLPLGPLRQAVLKLVRDDTTRPSDQQQSKGWLAAGVGGTRH